MRLHEAEMLPYQEKSPGGTLLSIVVRASHLRSALRMQMRYSITDHNFSNTYGDVEITKCYYDGRPWPSSNPPQVESVNLVPTELVVKNLSLALEYFMFAREHLDFSKEDPPNFETFLLHFRR